MKITAITRFKHGELYRLLQKLGWSQAELAQRSGLAPQTVGKIINLVKRPSEQQANAIQTALAEAGEFLDVLEQWPEAFQGIQKHVQTADIPMERLLDHPEVLQIPAETDDLDHDLVDRVNEVLEELPDKEHAALKGHFWEGMNHHQIGEGLGMTHQGAALVVARALRKLRHPERLRRLVPDYALEQAIDTVRKDASVVLKMSDYERSWPYSYQPHLPADMRLTWEEAEAKGLIKNESKNETSTLEGNPVGH